VPLTIWHLWVGSQVDLQRQGALCYEMRAIRAWGESPPQREAGPPEERSVCSCQMTGIDTARRDGPWPKKSVLVQGVSCVTNPLPLQAKSADGKRRRLQSPVKIRTVKVGEMNSFSLFSLVRIEPSPTGAIQTLHDAIRTRGPVPEVFVSVLDVPKGRGLEHRAG
jgi:hypothetical protein